MTLFQKNGQKYAKTLTNCHETSCQGGTVNKKVWVGFDIYSRENLFTAELNIVSHIVS